MSISYPISLPAGHRRALSFRPYSVVAMSMSPFTLAQQAQAHQGQIWVVRVTLTPMQRADADEWIAALLSLNGRYGTFLLGDESSTSPRGTGAVGAVTGSVTLAQTRLSLETGAAFVDLTGVDLATLVGNRIVLTDSAGKTLTGWLKAAGTGATYGATLLSNGGFDSDTTGWTEDSGSIASVAGGQTGNCLEVTGSGDISAADVPHMDGDVPWMPGDITYPTGGGLVQPTVTQAVAGQPSGRLYLLYGYVQSGTAGAQPAYLGVTFSSGTPITASVSGTTSGTWSLLELVVIAPVAGAALSEVWVQDAAVVTGTMLFDTLMLQQILTPSVTGATIVSTQGGSTYTWASEDSGFNRADPAGYTYTILNTIGNALVKGAGQTGQSLLTDNWAPNGTGVLLPGDWIQLGSGSTQRIHRVLQTVNANGSGEATIEIWPRLRESPADNAPITLTNCQGVFRLTHNDMPWDIDNDLLYGIELEAAEAL